MPDTFQYDIFLSHSAKDKAVMRAVAKRLRKDGLKVWPVTPKHPCERGFDEWELVGRDSVEPSKQQAKIEEGPEHPEFELQPSAFRLQPLLNAPLNKKRRFIPLRLDETPIKSSLAQFPRRRNCRLTSNHGYPTF